MRYEFFIFTLRPVNTIAARDLLTVKNNYVGVATDDPKTTFHIYGAADKDVYAGMGVNPLVGTSSAFNMGYSGHSFGEGSGFLNVRDAPGAVAPNPSLRFMTANVTRVIIDDEGFLGLCGGTAGLGGSFDPAHPIQARSRAHLTTGGIWTNTSSRELKQNIRPLGISVARVAALMLSVDPSLTPAEHESIMSVTALDMTTGTGVTPGWDARTGHGLVDADMALVRTDLLLSVFHDDFVNGDFQKWSGTVQ